MRIKIMTRKIKSWMKNIIQKIWFKKMSQNSYKLLIKINNKQLANLKNRPIKK